MSAEDRVSDYAGAFFESALERWIAALTGAAKQLEENQTLRERVAAVGADFGQRQRALDGVLPPDVDVPVRNFLYLLMQHNDLPLLPEIVEAVRKRVQQTPAAPTEVHVVSAIPLTSDQQRNLLDTLQQQYGPALDVHYRVDPAILGGLIVQIGDQLIDNSVAKRLAAMKQTLGVASSR